MPAITHRRLVSLAIAVTIALFISGCSTQMSSPAASPTSSRSTPALTATAAAPPHRPGPNDRWRASVATRNQPTTQNDG
jgi:hypothetical protein